jgi:hypothetical protein
VSRALVSVEECGKSDSMTVKALQRIANAVDARLVLDIQWNGAQLDRLLDARFPTLFARFAVRGHAAKAWMRDPTSAIAPATGLLVFEKLSGASHRGLISAKRVKRRPGPG